MERVHTSSSPAMLVSCATRNLGDFGSSYFLISKLYTYSLLNHPIIKSQKTPKKWIILIDYKKFRKNIEPTLMTYI